MSQTRVTVTLPEEVVETIDRRERNRSHFILKAVRRELMRLQRLELRRSLSNPHPESETLAEAGLAEWAAGLPDEDATSLVDSKGGRTVRWKAGRGWTEPRG